MCSDQEVVLISWDKLMIYQVGTWSHVLIRKVSRADNTYSYCKRPWTHLHLAPFCTHSVSLALEETKTNRTRNFNHHKKTTIYHIACSYNGVEDCWEITGDYWEITGDYWRLCYTLFMHAQPSKNWRNWRKT